MLTHLAQVTFPDGSTPPVSVLANEAAFLFAAGQETTARSLAFALQFLVDDRALQASLRADRNAIPTFVEEIFRLEAPVKSHFRLVRRTTTLGGVEIKAGTTVMLLIGGINRDPRRFDDADAVDLERASIYEHVAFAAASTPASGNSSPAPRCASRSNASWSAPPTSGSRLRTTVLTVHATTTTTRRSSSGVCARCTWSSRPADSTERLPASKLRSYAAT